MPNTIASASACGFRADACASSSTSTTHADHDVIKNAVVHVLNEQPLLADLYEMPKPLDQGLLCTNLRTMDGKRPVFVDRMESIFYFPYLHIRFLEILPSTGGLAQVAAP